MKNMGFEHSILITGGTSGIGYQAAEYIAQDCPKDLVVLIARSDKTKAAEALNAKLQQSNVIFLPLDLSNPDEVRRFARDWVEDSTKPPIKVLICNAALQFPTGRTLTPEGMEKTFAIAHVGHALLFHLMFPRLATGARVLIMGSGTHDPAQGTGMPKPEYTTAQELAFPPPSVNMPGTQRYTTAKFCNIIWMYALARHLQQAVPERRISVNAMDPGFVPGTGMARESGPVVRFIWSRILPRIVPLMRLLYLDNIHTVEEAAMNMARLVIAPEFEGISGRYWEGNTIIRSSKDTYVEEYQEDLWKWTINYIAGGNPERAAQLESFK